MRFFSPKTENEVKTWTKLVNRVFVDSFGKKKTFQVSKYTKICSNNFEYGRPVGVASNPILFLKGYDDDAKVGVKRKAPGRRRSSYKKYHQIQSISHFLHVHQAEWKNQLVQRLLMFL